MKIELVGGPHCGATADAVPERQETIWCNPSPRANVGAAYQVPYSNGPATTLDVAYRYDGDRKRYLYCGPYDVA